MERIYNTNIRFRWAEAKRKLNLRNHGLDLSDAIFVFESTTLTVEDARFGYLERRFMTLGLLDGMVVSVVHTEAANEIRIISLRKATKREVEEYFRALSG